MKDQHPTISGSESWKNLAAGAVAGAMLGMAFGIGFNGLPIGLVLGILLGIAVGYSIGRAPIKMKYPMYIVRRLLLAGALFVLTGLGYVFAQDHGWTGKALTLTCLVMAIGWAILVIAVGSAIASLDEMQRRIQTEAIAIGFAGTAIAAGGYGLLGFAGVVQVNWGLVPAVMILMWLVGKLWTL